MPLQQPQRSGKSATARLTSQQHYTLNAELDNISASEYNQIKNELRLLRIDFDRIYNGYKQLGIAHAELLLDQQSTWREYLLCNVYVNTIHPDVREDIATFLETVERHTRLRGAV